MYLRNYKKLNGFLAFLSLSQVTLAIADTPQITFNGGEIPYSLPNQEFSAKATLSRRPLMNYGIGELTLEAKKAKVFFSLSDIKITDQKLSFILAMDFSCENFRVCNRAKSVEIPQPRLKMKMIETSLGFIKVKTEVPDGIEYNKESKKLFKDAELIKDTESHFPILANHGNPIEVPLPQLVHFKVLFENASSNDGQSTSLRSAVLKLEDESRNALEGQIVSAITHAIREEQLSFNKSLSIQTKEIRSACVAGLDTCFKALKDSEIVKNFPPAMKEVENAFKGLKASIPSTKQLDDLENTLNEVYRNRVIPKLKESLPSLEKQLRAVLQNGIQLSPSSFQQKMSEAFPDGVEYRLNLARQDAEQAINTGVLTLKNSLAEFENLLESGVEKIKEEATEYGKSIDFKIDPDKLFN
jgi:hypothetical protein